MMPPDHYQNQSKFNKYLFRSDHLITTSPLSLTHASGGFDASECHYSVNQGSVDIGDFLRTTEKFILQFSQLIADISAGRMKNNSCYVNYTAPFLTHRMISVLHITALY